MKQSEILTLIHRLTQTDLVMCIGLMNLLNTEFNKDPNLWDLERNFNAILKSNNLAEINELNERNYKIFNDCYWTDDRIERKVLTDWEGRNILIDELTVDYVDRPSEYKDIEIPKNN